MTAASAELWTVGRVVRWITGFFESKGIDTPRLDAELLAGHALGLSRVQIYTDFHRPLNPPELAAIRALVQRRGRREPVAYILGQRGFYELELAVDSRVLIPRPETERLVELAIERIAARFDEAAQVTVVDVGTGSGAIALSIKQAHPATTVIAIDTSAEALEVARANARANEIEGVEFVLGDGLAAAGDIAPDLVVSNPPYIPTADVANLTPDVVRYEPHLALDGGPDGLRVIEPLVASAGERLPSGGRLLMEIGADQGPRISALFDRAGHWAAVELHRDYGGHDRIVEARRR